MRAVWAGAARQELLQIRTFSAFRAARRFRRRRRIPYRLCTGTESTESRYSSFQQWHPAGPPQYQH
jgi:hypothetical protein